MKLDLSQSYMGEGGRGERAKALLTHFGSLQNIFNATQEQLANVDGIHEELAKFIRGLLERNSPKIGTKIGTI